MRSKIITTFINMKNYYNVQKGASTSLYKRGAAEAAPTSTVQISKRSGAFQTRLQSLSNLCLIVAHTKRRTHFKKKMNEEEGNSKEEINEEDGGHE